MKKIRKLLRMVIIYVVVVAMSCLCVSASTAGEDWGHDTNLQMNMPRSYNRLFMTIPKNSWKKASESFSMNAGQSVVIEAKYSPPSASVDFGLLDSAGEFYYFRGENGNFNQGLVIQENGMYTLAVQNNSPVDVEVAGFVYY